MSQPSTSAAPVATSSTPSANVATPAARQTIPITYDISNDFDEHYAGRAIVHRKLFAQTRAGLKGLFANTRAWAARKGTLFADTIASIKTLRPWFANTRLAFKEYRAAKLRREIDSHLKRLEAELSQATTSGQKTSIRTTLLQLGSIYYGPLAKVTVSTAISELRKQAMKILLSPPAPVQQTALPPLTQQTTLSPIPPIPPAPAPSATKNQEKANSDEIAPNSNHHHDELWHFRMLN
jgi:hypothetical protein